MASVRGAVRRALIPTYLYHNNQQLWNAVSIPQHCRDPSPSHHRKAKAGLEALTTKTVMARMAAIVDGHHVTPQQW